MDLRNITARIETALLEGRLVKGDDGFVAFHNPSSSQIKSLSSHVAGGAVRYIIDLSDGSLYAFDAMEWIHSEAIAALSLSEPLIGGVVFLGDGVWRRHTLAYDENPPEDGDMEQIFGNRHFRRAFSAVLPEIEAEELG